MSIAIENIYKAFTNPKSSDIYMRRICFLSLLLAFALTACSPSIQEIPTQTADAWTATPAPTKTPSLTTTPTITSTPTSTPTVTPTNTATNTPTLTTVPISEGVSTYSDVLNTYPEGVNLCLTESNLDSVDPNGNWRLSGTIEGINNEPQLKCYGTKINVNISIEIEGRTYEPGTKLTVDNNLEWFMVSSWE